MANPMIDVLRTTVRIAAAMTLQFDDDDLEAYLTEVRRAKAHHDAIGFLFVSPLDYMADLPKHDAAARLAEAFVVFARSARALEGRLQDGDV